MLNDQPAVAAVNAEGAKRRTSLILRERAKGRGARAAPTHEPLLWEANEEFRAAHEHLKAGEYKDCAVDALNALESTMKAICEAKNWRYQKGARATDLLKILRQENLFPEFLDQSFEQLLATLKSGLPAVRNQSGGHGQGPVPVETPDYVAVYALNLAASKIRFLVEAFRHSEKRHRQP